jgi:hypothetical protein
MAIFALSAAALPVSLSPATTSNTYSGVLTLQVSGLTNGEPVIVETYLDVNGNGVIDAGEPLMDSFRIGDGSVKVIGGVTNLNVPWDSNPSPGAITTVLNLSQPVERAIGNHMFRVSSPFGNFTPQTNIWMVTNANLGQTVSGTISEGEVPVPYAMAVALSLPDTDFAGSVFADASGHYSIHLDPGTYVIMPTLPNYFTDQSLAPQVTLTNGGSATANLFLTNGSSGYTLSGQVLDATNSAPLGGVFLQFESGNRFAIGFSDNNGNYSAALSPSFWKIKFESSRLPRRAYVVSQNNVQVDLTGGSAANVNLPLIKANALFYGRFTNNVGAPFPNIDFFAQDNSQQLKAEGFSDANGNYVVAVFANGTDQWNNMIDSGQNPQLQGFLASGTSGSVPIAAGQAIRQDFTAIQSTTQISGHVADNSGNPITDVGVSGFTVVGGASFNVSTKTDASGNYVLPAVAGSWSVNVNCCGDHGLDSYGLSDPQMHSLSIPPANPILNLTVYPIGTPFLGQGFRLSSTQFGFNVNGSIGANYTVQSSTDLSHWSDLFSLNLTNNSMFVQDNQATNALRFYRVRKN